MSNKEERLKEMCEREGEFCDLLTWQILTQQFLKVSALINYEKITYHFLKLKLFYSPKIICYLFIIRFNSKIGIKPRI